jgi:hypothetical protein
VSRWTMYVERWPGGSSMEDAPTGDRLKTMASDLWKSAHQGYSRVAKMRFTIYDPAGGKWQTCTRYSDGSWRARWDWCPPEGNLLEGD